ncbi:MAG: hypothetical protein HF982_09710 [Desulfobacteraceae bacterium]|nr:hypothetical protein [Desulfobacteraceae bacterium]MBC2719841.1 hypothetical protein [Desulfobacteraceae bacterium]
MTTNRDRTFRYYNEAVVNETGWYRINVPYSNYGTPYGGWKTEPYKIQCLESNVPTEVIISEAEIISGKNIQVDLIE